MGFAELFVIAIVGMIVIGPDKLPDAIKTGMRWFGRVKRLINQTRSEFEEQLGVDEIRRELHNEQVLESLEALKKIKEETEAQAREAGIELNKIAKEPLPDPEPEDEGLYGEQHANHPPEPSEDASTSPTNDAQDTNTASNTADESASINSVDSENATKNSHSS